MFRFNLIFTRPKKFPLNGLNGFVFFSKLKYIYFSSSVFFLEKRMKFLRFQIISEISIFFFVRFVVALVSYQTFKKTLRNSL